MNESARVAVVGVGAIGLTTAFDLVERGARVMLFECDVPGCGSTGRAADICYDAYAEDTDAVVAGSAVDRFRSLSGEGGFALHETPYIFLAREGDDVVAAALGESVERMRVHDCAVSPVGTDKLGDRFPIRTDDVLLAGVAENAGWVDPVAYVNLLVEQCESVGVASRVGDVVMLRTDPLAVAVDDVVAARFDAVVVAVGVHSRRLFVDAGYPIAFEPYRAQALATDCDYCGPTVYDATDESHLRLHPGGVLADDGVESVEPDPDDWDPTADDWFVADVLDGVHHRTGIDGLDEAGGTAAEADQSNSAWVGLCEAIPDWNPLVGVVAEGVYAAAGWHGHGSMQAPAIGERLVETVLGDGQERIPAAFGPRRFDGDEEFAVIEGMTLDGDQHETEVRRGRRAQN